MNIDPEFVKTTIEFIDQTLEAYKAAGVSPTVGDTPAALYASKVWSINSIVVFTNSGSMFIS